MRMLKTIAMSLMLLFATNAYADKPVLDVYIASGNSGASWVEGNMIRDGLERLGYDSQVIWTKNCANTVKHIAKGGARPGFIFHSVGKQLRNEQKGCNLEVNEDTFIMPMYSRLQTMCVRSDSGFTSFDDFIKGKDKITIATTNTLPGGADTYKALSDQTGKRFVRVDYDGQKKLTAGLLGGDTDMMYSSYRKAEFGNPELNCFTTSANKEIDGLPTMKSLFPNWKLSTMGTFKFFRAIELPADRFAEVRAALGKVILEDPKFGPYVSNAKMVPGTEYTTEEALATYRATYDLWKN